MIVIIIAIVLVVLDQLSKLWVVNTLVALRDIPIWDGVLHFHYAENTGAAFSLLSDASWFYLFVSATAFIASIGIVIYVLTRKYKLHKLEIISLGLILSGAIGNLIDRLRFKYVIDFIYVKIINFAIFNVADACLVVGSILLSIYILFIHEKYMKKNDNEALKGEESKDEEPKDKESKDEE